MATVTVTKGAKAAPGVKTKKPAKTANTRSAPTSPLGLDGLYRRDGAMEPAAAGSEVDAGHALEGRQPRFLCPACPAQAALRSRGVFDALGISARAIYYCEHIGPATG